MRNLRKDITKIINGNLSKEDQAIQILLYLNDDVNLSLNGNGLFENDSIMKNIYEDSSEDRRNDLIHSYRELIIAGDDRMEFDTPLEEKVSNLLTDVRILNIFKVNLIDTCHDLISHNEFEIKNLRGIGETIYTTIISALDDEFNIHLKDNREIKVNYIIIQGKRYSGLIRLKNESNYLFHRRLRLDYFINNLNEDEKNLVFSSRYIDESRIRDIISGKSKISHYDAENLSKKIPKEEISWIVYGDRSRNINWFRGEYY